MASTVNLAQTQLAMNTLNSSPSKSLYSFPKSRRFHEATKSYCGTAFYELPSQKFKRGAALGYGNKSDFTLGDKFKPSPQQYNLKTCFETNKFKGKGSSFNSRANIKFGNFPVVTKTPGPGSYETDIANRPFKYSLGKRTDDP